MNVQTSVLQKYDEWLAEHMEELVARHAGRVLAIHEGQVCFVGDSEVEVYQWVRQANLEPMPPVFRVPREEDMHAILGGH